MPSGKNNGYFPYPNVIVDRLMPHLSGTQYKMISVIVRKTIGWHKFWDKISINQFRELIGTSRSGVIQSRDDLKKMELILHRNISNPGKLPESWYALNCPSCQKAKLVQIMNQSKNKTSTNIGLEVVHLLDYFESKLVQIMYPQKKDLKTDLKTRSIDPVLNFSLTYCIEIIGEKRALHFLDMLEEEDFIRTVEAGRKYIDAYRVESPHSYLYSALSNEELKK